MYFLFFDFHISIFNMWRYQLDNNFARFRALSTYSIRMLNCNMNFYCTLEPRYKSPRHRSLWPLHGKTKRSCPFARAAQQRIICMRGPFSEFICFSPFYFTIRWPPWFKSPARGLSDVRSKNKSPEEALVSKFQCKFLKKSGKKVMHYLYYLIFSRKCIMKIEYKFIDCNWGTPCNNHQRRSKQRKQTAAKATVVNKKIWFVSKNFSKAYRSITLQYLLSTRNFLATFLRLK